MLVCLLHSFCVTFYYISPFDRTNPIILRKENNFWNDLTNNVYWFYKKTYGNIITQFRNALKAVATVARTTGNIKIQVVNICLFTFYLTMLFSNSD